MKIQLKYRGYSFPLEVRRVPKVLEGIGLMFSRRNTKPLLFSFRKPVLIPIHSFFVFYKFVAAWLDENLEVIETRIVKPFSVGVVPSRKFKYLVEIPFSKDYEEILKFLVDKERFK